MLQGFKKGTKQTSRKECRQQRDIDLANHLHATGYLFQPHSKLIAQFPSSSFALPKLPVQHELHMRSMPDCVHSFTAQSVHSRMGCRFWRSLGSRLSVCHSLMQVLIR